MLNEQQETTQIIYWFRLVLMIFQPDGNQMS